MNNETKIYDFKIVCEWKAGTLLTEEEAINFLKKEIELLKAEWLFNMKGYINNKEIP